MGRPANKVPSYLRHSSGQARIRIDGQDIYLGKYGSAESKEAYARYIAENCSAGERPTIFVRGGEALTIAALVVKYDDFIVSYYRKNGQSTSQVERIRAAVRPLLELYGSCDVCEFGPIKLKAVRTQIIKTGSRKLGKRKERLETPLSRGYVNSLIGCVKRMFKWAVAEELVPVAVHQALMTVESLKLGRAEGMHEPAPVKPVPDEHLQAVLAIAPPHIATMIEVQLLTGMRPDEITIMRPMDIDRSYDVWSYRPGSHKTEHHEIDKVILIGPRAQNLLKPWIDRSADSYLFSPKEYMEEFNANRRKNRKSPMTPSQSKRRRKRRPIKTARDHYDDSSYRRAVLALCKKAEVEQWTPGQLRHNTGTQIQARFHSIEAAMVVLGHQEFSTTQIYAEKDMQRYSEIMRAVG